MISYNAIKKNMLLSSFYCQDTIKCTCGGHDMDHAPDCPVKQIKLKQD